MDTSQVSKELAIRKRLGKIFKKKRDDFDTEEEYNDYLEVFEDVVYNLSEGINSDEAQKSMERLRKYVKDTDREEIMEINVQVLNTDNTEQPIPSIVFLDPARPAKPMPVPLRAEEVDESIRRRASGFDENLCHKRAQHELMSSLFFRKGA
ncbi:hypothetical protein GpartN1_g7556.t1 [Galdieria partita]|uniref:MAT1 centre domain-containing protein n=1 Tax=Galdieria partita TaxID=83374 RepID=A0A9C7Q4V7_9RHOD|nr:hypothetical protein GpartN1_g7556.t1 [Galdieria partita]